MELLPRPSLRHILEIEAARYRAWRTRESTSILGRRLLCLAAIFALGLIGPLFIKLWIFPDRPTGVAGPRGCVYDAAIGHPANRYDPAPTPELVITGTIQAYTLTIVNSGTCAWDESMALVREGGNLPTSQTAISRPMRTFRC